MLEGTDAKRGMPQGMPDASKRCEVSATFTQGSPTYTCDRSEDLGYVHSWLFIDIHASDEARWKVNRILPNDEKKFCAFKVVQHYGCEASEAPHKEE